MVWFKVDDGFYSHPKTVLIPRAGGLRALAAGTWTLCGTWSASKKLDGFIPTHMLDEVGGTIEGANALVTVKLWKRARGGFQFVNWSEFQPTRAEQDEAAEKERVRKADYRAAVKARKDAEESELVPVGQIGVPSTPSRPVPSRKLERVKHVGPVSETQVDGPTGLSTGSAPVSGFGDELARVIELVREECGRDLDVVGAGRVIEYIWKRRGPNADPVRSAVRYFATTIRKTPIEFQQFVDEQGIAV